MLFATRGAAIVPEAGQLSGLPGVPPPVGRYGNDGLGLVSKKPAAPLVGGGVFRQQQVLLMVRLLKSCGSVRLGFLDGPRHVLADAVVTDQADALVVSDKIATATCAAAISSLAEKM